MRICVVALGKIGLPLAVQFASKGHQVVGADSDAERVRVVNAGVEPFPGEHLLDSMLTQAVRDGLLTATTDTTAAVSESDAVVVVVPMFVGEDGAPEFGPMEAATRSIAAGLRPGTLVSYETTVPVGTTRGRLTPLLQDVSGLTAGRDFDVVFSPERVLSGRVFEDLRRYPKLVGGIDAQSSRRGVEFYSTVLDFDERRDLPRPNGVWDLDSAEAAELAKLAETTYRDVNIGLANQFARYADSVGVDMATVIEACNSQPFSHLHHPGIAVGGHCIPVYPQMYLWNDPDATIVDAARQANLAMPEYSVSLLAEAWGDLNAVPVIVLGAAYRGGVKETAYSGVFDLVEALRRRGASPFVTDPLYSATEIESLGLPPYRGERVVAGMIQADHPEYRDLEPNDFPDLRVLVDGRRVTEPANWNGNCRVVIGG